MTNAELAILTILAESPYHGYEIEEVIERRGMRDWTEVGFSSIYYLLRKLEREGLIEKQLAKPTRGPSRKVYRLTEPGQDAMQAAICDLLATPRQLYPPIQLGLSSLDLIPSDMAIQALNNYEAALRERLETVITRRKNAEPSTTIDAVYAHSESLLQAELDWVSNFVANLQANGSSR